MIGTQCCCPSELDEVSDCRWTEERTLQRNVTVLICGVTFPPADHLPTARPAWADDWSFLRPLTGWINGRHVLTYRGSLPFDDFGGCERSKLMSFPKIDGVNSFEWFDPSGVYHTISITSISIAATGDPFFPAFGPTGWEFEMVAADETSPGTVFVQRHNGEAIHVPRLGREELPFIWGQIDYRGDPDFGFGGTWLDTLDMTVVVNPDAGEDCN